jgi:hypothetical protein
MGRRLIAIIGVVVMLPGLCYGLAVSSDLAEVKSRMESKLIEKQMIENGVTMFMFKGSNVGLNPEIKDNVLKKLAPFYYIHEGERFELDRAGMVKRWGDVVVKSFVEPALQEAAVSLEDKKLIIVAKNLILQIRDAVNPDMYTNQLDSVVKKIVENAHKHRKIGRLACFLDTFITGAQYIILVKKENVAKKDIANFFDLSFDLEKNSLAEQDLFKQVVVGKKDLQEHQLRKVILDSYDNKSNIMLQEFVDKSVKKYGITIADVKEMQNGIHSSASDEFADEIDLLVPQDKNLMKTILASLESKRKTDSAA